MSGFSEGAARDVLRSAADLWFSIGGVVLDPSWTVSARVARDPNLLAYSMTLAVILSPWEGTAVWCSTVVTDVELEDVRDWKTVVVNAGRYLVRQVTGELARRGLVEVLPRTRAEFERLFPEVVG